MLHGNEPCAGSIKKNILIGKKAYITLHLILATCPPPNLHKLVNLASTIYTKQAAVWKPVFEKTLSTKRQMMGHGVSYICSDIQIDFFDRPCRVCVKLKLKFRHHDQRSHDEYVETDQSNAMRRSAITTKGLRMFWHAKWDTNTTPRTFREFPCTKLASKKKKQK